MLCLRRESLVFENGFRIKPGMTFRETGMTRYSCKCMFIHRSDAVFNVRNVRPDHHQSVLNS